MRKDTFPSIHFLKRLFALAFLFLILNGTRASAQTCSCAGAPLIGSQSTGTTEQGSLLIGLTYEFNEITRLYSGSDQLTNDSSERNTQSTLLELNYGITDRLSLSGTFSFVYKERVSGLRNPGGTQSSSTTGIGDGLLMLRYNIVQQSLWNRYHLAAGAGAKAPLGNTSHDNNSGLLFNADMQSGTGAWDGVFWGYGAVSLLPFSTANISLTSSYRLTGENERFNDSDNYQFGNELVLALRAANGITDRFGYSAGVRYRSTSSDRLNEAIQPNTGGKWVSLISGINYGFSDRISASVSGRLPVYQYLKGTQPTTTFSASASLFINFNSSNNQFSYGNSQ